MKPVSEVLKGSIASGSGPPADRPSRCGLTRSRLRVTLRRRVGLTPRDPAHRRASHRGNQGWEADAPDHAIDPAWSGLPGDHWHEWGRVRTSPPPSAQALPGPLPAPSLFSVTGSPRRRRSESHGFYPHHLQAQEQQLPSLPGNTITSSGDGVASGIRAILGARLSSAVFPYPETSHRRRAQAGWPASSRLFGSADQDQADSAFPSHLTSLR